MKKILSILATAALPLALGAFTLPPLPVPKEAAVIYNPGNADYTGFRIVVQSSGKTISVDATGKTEGRLPADLSAAFFADLAAAMPLPNLTLVPCDKSSMNANALVITWQGQRSPDLSCAGDARGAALYADAQLIAKKLYVSAYRSASIPTVSGTGGAPPPVTGQPAPQQPPPEPMPNPYPGGYPL